MESKILVFLHITWQHYVIWQLNTQKHDIWESNGSFSQNKKYNKITKQSPLGVKQHYIIFDV